LGFLFFYANNYFLYDNPVNNKFQYLINDLDLTFGLEYGATGLDTLNIYNWKDPVNNRPLVSKILAEKEYRQNFAFYLKQLLHRFPPDSIRKTGIIIQNSIAPYVQNDPYYSYSMDEFYDALDGLVYSNITPIMPFVNTRYHSILEQLDNSNIKPIISNVCFNNPGVNDTIHISANVEDDDTISSFRLTYFIDDENKDSIDLDLAGYGSLWGSFQYNMIIPPLEKDCKISCFLTARDTHNNISRYPESGTFDIYVHGMPPKLMVNEFLTKNDNSITDRYGEHEDWIEVYNADTINLNLSHFYLTDNFSNPGKWKLPNINLQKGGQSFFWADEDEDQGKDHCSFKLSNSGETIYLFEKLNGQFNLADSIAFKKMDKDISFGRLTDGSEDLDELRVITPGLSNSMSGAAYAVFKINMNYMFKKQTFFENWNVGVIGNFNSWDDSESFYDMNNDSTYTYTVFGLTEGDEIEYRFRINHSDQMVEFKDLPGSEGNRKAVLKEGCNVFKHIFNDEIYVSTNEITENNRIFVYPNPVRDYLYIQTTFTNDRIKVSDMFGRIMIDKPSDNSERTTLSLMGLNPGIYLVQIFNKNQLIKVEKIIRQ
jgi:hypothetical protein